MNKTERIKKHVISSAESMQSAMKLMDELDSKLLIVIDEDRFHSLLSIGDIQRAIISGKPISDQIGSILRTNIKVANTTQDKSEVRSKMLEFRTEFMPILDEDQQLVDVIFWDETFDIGIKENDELKGIPVVIMAGGKGTRLRPITNIIPKPLIPLGEKPVIQIIMDNFRLNGATKFYFSVNYKADLIKHFFDDMEELKYDITYFREDKPLGTAGSLKLLEEKINTTFFVSNCDILIDQDYSEVYQYHKENKNELTLIAAIKNYSIPYGTLETEENGLLRELKEKPSLSFKVNAGMYLLEPHLMDEIPNNEFFHITHLMEKIIQRGGRVGVFPVSEGAWMDTGEWDVYNQTQKNFTKRFGK